MYVSGSHLPKEALTRYVGILAWRWADKGIADRYDQAIAAVLIVMNSIAGLVTLRKAGWSPPPVSLLLGTSALTVASQIV